MKITYVLKAQNEWSDFYHNIGVFDSLEEARSFVKRGDFIVWRNPKIFRQEELIQEFEETLE
jgi:hypothetical protein